MASVSELTLLVLLVASGSFRGCHGKAIGSCEIDLDQMQPDPPLILNEDGQFIYPEGSRILSFGASQKVLLLCHGGDKSVFKETKSVRGNQLVTLECGDSGHFQTTSGPKSTTVNVHKLSCQTSNSPAINIREPVGEGTLCADLGADGRHDFLKGNIMSVDIGWDIPNKGFIQQIQVCLDAKVFGTLWTKHTVKGRSIDFRDKDPVRPGFRADTQRKSRFFDGLSSSRLNMAYSKKGQIDAIVKALGQNKLYGSSNTPIIDDQPGGVNYLARGHLSPDAAFIYNAEQDATYFFVNVAPQFQSFNNGNWKQLEAATMTLASRMQRDIVVYQGTVDILSYKDKKGKDKVNIFLLPDSNLLPIPLYFWKVLYDPVKHRAAAFLGLNDPYDTDVTDFLCENVCDQLDWIGWKPDKLKDKSKGHLTCCKLENLRNGVSFVPDLRNKAGSWPSLLTTSAF